MKKKAVGIENIPIKFLKMTAKCTSLLLSKIFNTVELRLSELIKTRGGSDKLIVRIIEQHAIHMKLDHIQCIKSTVQRGTWLFIVHY